VNVRWKRFWLASENRFIRLRVSNRGMRIIDKKGIETVLAELKGRCEKVQVLGE
jgi:large subunit ribosomal protein L28